MKIKHRVVISDVANNETLCKNWSSFSMPLRSGKKNWKTSKWDFHFQKFNGWKEWWKLLEFQPNCTSLVKFEKLEIKVLNARLLQRIYLRKLKYSKKQNKNFKVPTKWNFRLLFYSIILKSMILWFVIFEFGLRTSACEFYLELQSWPIRVKLCDIPRAVKICKLVHLTS